MKAQVVVLVVVAAVLAPQVVLAKKKEGAHQEDFEFVESFMNTNPSESAVRHNIGTVPGCGGNAVTLYLHQHAHSSVSWPTD
ncbi:hypothetical protein Pmani_025058 [Petrolisthes manimaculis]|uniref:Uncharacterized protein n=1 Tax=Petrolisthes manimaculis TaxID=1843537 RepID=A0AAE1P6W8_9EUCA|nr:hypothetical protein Pmani_025058 [Petrolisthes manimaculis]